MVKGTHSHEAKLGQATVFTPNSRLTFSAAKYEVRSAAIGRNRERRGRSRQKLNAIGLNESIEHKGAASLPLTSQAMTAMDEHRRRPKPIAHAPASASSF
jgi:hypothetical protein